MLHVVVLPAFAHLTLPVWPGPPQATKSSTVPEQAVSDQHGPWPVENTGLRSYRTTSTDICVTSQCRDASSRAQA